MTWQFWQPMSMHTGIYREYHVCDYLACAYCWLVLVTLVLGPAYSPAQWRRDAPLCKDKYLVLWNGVFSPLSQVWIVLVQILSKPIPLL